MPSIPRSRRGLAIFVIAIFLIGTIPLAASSERDDDPAFGWWSWGASAWSSLLEVVFAADSGHLDPNGSEVVDSPHPPAQPVIKVMNSEEPRS